VKSKASREDNKENGRARRPAIIASETFEEKGKTAKQSLFFVHPIFEKEVPTESLRELGFLFFGWQSFFTFNYRRAL
jgi:hypothetical protein